MAETVVQEHMSGRPRRQGVLPYQVEVTDKSDGLTSRAGLPLVVETMRALGIAQAVSEHMKLQQREGGLTDCQKLESVVLLMAAGGNCYDDMRVLQADEGLQRLIGYSLPSPDAVRAFANAFHDETLVDQAKDKRPEGTVAYIPSESELLAGLAAVNVALCQAVAARGKGTRATLDHDATIQESRKQQALLHYKGGRGYQPSCVYFAEQDLIIGDEYRDGNVPAGMDNLPLIRRAFASLPPTIVARFFRADSACYEQSVLKWLADEHRPSGPMGPIGFSISADMTPELRQACEAVAVEQWELVEERANETLYCADVEFAPGDWPKKAEPLRFVAVRIQKKQGALFASGADTRYLAVVSNRRSMKPADLLRWHWEKAGTIEHVHDVTKNELGASTPPSKYFGANAAWYRMSLLTYNVLSAMKSMALPPSLGSARPKKLRFCLFNLAGKISSHAGSVVLCISKVAEQIVGLIAARAKLLELLALPA